MYDFQVSAALPLVSIPSPVGLLVLKIRKSFVRASRVFHSAGLGFSECHGVSACDVSAVV